MKIPVLCMECFFDNKVYEIRDVEMNNDGLFEYECKNGHKRVTILQIEKFEALFDIGVEAFMNGYRTEAVACMTASLERFFEWFIYVVCLKNDIDYDLIDEAWKPLSNASQRQLGAYLLMYLREFNECAPKIDNNKTGFRNNVLHKGYIPSHEEVLDYGEYILKYIRTVLDRMGNDYRDYYHTKFLNQIEILRSKYSNVQSSTMAIPTVIGLTSDSKIDSMEMAIEHIRNRNKVNESMRNMPADILKQAEEFRKQKE